MFGTINFFYFLCFTIIVRQLILDAPCYLADDFDEVVKRASNVGVKKVYIYTYTKIVKIYQWVVNLKAANAVSSARISQ